METFDKKQIEILFAGWLWWCCTHIIDVFRVESVKTNENKTLKKMCPSF